MIIGGYSLMVKTSNCGFDKLSSILNIHPFIEFPEEIPPALRAGDPPALINPPQQGERHPTHLHTFYTSIHLPTPPLVLLGGDTSPHIA